MKNMEFSKNIKNSATLWYSDPTSGDLSGSIWNRIFKRYLYSHVHRSFIPSHQKLEPILMPIDEWMDKENVVYRRLEY